jgi:hypothetical protein
MDRKDESGRPDPEILDYGAAVRLAYAFFAEAARRAEGLGETHHGGVLTVSAAIDEYLKARRPKAGKAARALSPTALLWPAG